MQTGVLTAQLNYDDAASPNSQGNYGVSNVEKTGPGVFDVSLIYGYNPASDSARVTCTGATPGIPGTDVVPGDTGKIRVRTFDAAGVPADRPWSLSINRAALLTGPQTLLHLEPPRARACPLTFPPFPFTLEAPHADPPVPLCAGHRGGSGSLVVDPRA